MTTIASGPKLVNHAPLFQANTIKAKPVMFGHTDGSDDFSSNGTVVPTPERLSKAAIISAEAEAKPLSNKQRLESVEKQSLEVFGKYKSDPQGFLDYLKTEFGSLGVEVRSGKEEPWVDTFLDQCQTTSLFLMPNSLSYPGQVLDSDTQKIKALGTQSWPEFTALSATQDRDGKFGLLLHSNVSTPKQASLNSPFHGVFQLFQKMHGLPFTGTQFKAQVEAAVFQQQFLTAEGPFKKYAKSTTPILKYFINFVRTVKLVFRQGWLKGMQQYGDLKEVPNGPGQHLRIQMQRQIEALSFLIKNAEHLGLNTQDIKINKQTLNLYKNIQGISWELDLKAKTDRAHQEKN